MKFGLTLAFLLILQIFSLSNISGEIEDNSTKMEHDASKDFSELLKDEKKSQFFSNQKSGDFQKNFVRKETQGLPNSILIKEGTSVKLSGTIERSFSTILVEGDLRIIDTGDSSLKVQKIIVAPSGSLTIGDNQSPIKADKKAEIVFLSNNEGEVGIFVFGKLWIHGKEVSQTFVGLEKFARKWDKRLVVDTELTNWKRDDVVVITSPGDDKCNEVSKISKVVNQDVFLQTQLTCSHIGIENTKNSITSHVALLSRNIIISSEDEENRGSVNFFHGSYGYIKYAQFDKLGPKEVLARYPIHFHHLKDTSRGIEVIGNSITYSDNRWITIHDSNGIIVKDNVGYISQGHGFFLEDGTEFDNVFEKNIGIIVKRELIRPDGAPSVFWTMNPMNVYRDNVAVNAPYWGFFFDIPDEEVDIPNSDKQFNLRSLPSLEFEGNIAYNNQHGGIRVARHAIEDKELTSSEIIISNFHAVGGSVVESERHFGILITGSGITITNSTILNHKSGIHLEGQRNIIMDSTIKMESNYKPDSKISGIVIAGRNNLIENSEINGYVSKNNHEASDISLYNNENYKRLMSAKIINPTLLDPVPFYIGNPTNENSFLEIYDYNEPSAYSKNLPQNFILKKIGSEPIEKRGEYNNLVFDAMIKVLNDTQPKNQLGPNDKTELDNFKKIKSELIISFKSKAHDWINEKLSDKELLDEIEILFESRLIEIGGIEQGSFKEYNFVIPEWVKKLVDFWVENSTTDQELLNAIEYIFQIQIPGISLYR